MHILAIGTYEGGVLLYDIEENKQVVGYKSHLGCIKSMSSCQNVLVSTSTDESVKLYDMETRRELGQLKEHDGYVTACAVHGRSYFISGGEDGKICIWSYSDLRLSKTFSGNAPVTAMALHPSGRVLLSAHKSENKRRPFITLWDLTRGTSAMSLDLDLNIQSVAWSGSGDRYALLPEDGLNIQVLERTTSSVQSYTRKAAERVTCIAFSDETLLLGDSTGKVVAQKKGEEQVVLRPAGSPGRVKGIVVSPDGVIVFAFNDGLCEVYRGDRDEVQQFDAEVRLTSIAIGWPKVVKKQRRGKRAKKRRAKLAGEDGGEENAAGQKKIATVETFKAKKRKKSTDELNEAGQKKIATVETFKAKKRKKSTDELLRKASKKTAKKLRGA